MSCGCKSPLSIHSWYDFEDMTPQDPLDLIAYAALNSDVGVPFNSSVYSTPAPFCSWIATPVVVSSGPTVSTNATDSGMMVQDAVDWSFSHKTANLLTTVAPPLHRLIFIRAGLEWKNVIPLNLGASPTFAILELSFLENAASRGDAQGTVPVIRWIAGAPFSGAKNLTLIVKRPGRFTLGLMGINTNAPADWTMLELDIVAV